jgi:hypothetical protein
MKMRIQKSTLLLTILLISFSCKSQNDTIKKNYENIKDLNAQIKKDTIENLIYVDSTFNYKVEIPEWLTLRETGNDKIIGGTFPKIENIENALMIKGFDKSEFKSFDEFKEIYITGNKFGKETLYSKNHIWYGRNERDLKIIDNGISSRVFTLFNKMIYHNQYVLIETKNAFLWIQFVATPETYELNLPKFNEFMLKFELLE